MGISITAPGSTARAMIADGLPREGLPFWMFYLLISIILLLLIFIFLRDKDLRRRLSSFLSGARRKMIRFRLSIKLKREKRKCADLRKDLGKKIWSEGLLIEDTTDIREQLKTCDEEKASLQQAWQDLSSRVDDLNSRAGKERARADALIEERKAAVLSIEATLRVEAGTLKDASGDPRESEDMIRMKTLAEEIHSVQDEAAKTAAGFAEEIKALEKEREVVQKKIIDLRRRSEPLFESLGRAAEAKRPPHKELGVIYFQIDSVQKTIRDLKDKIEKLR